MRRDGQLLRVLEWGAGKSTLWYTEFLDRLNAPYRWLSLEHDEAFVRDVVEPELEGRRAAQAIEWRGKESAEEFAAALAGPGTLVVSFGAGVLRPDLPGREHDRVADLDEYVDVPVTLRDEWDLAWDLVVVDGRKRRRCLLSAAHGVADDGYVMLHDAWRRHYQCAWRAYPSGRRVGDEWWVGSRRETDFKDVFPWHAFERHEEPGPGLD
jgi:hypothetical protein